MNAFANLTRDQLHIFSFATSGHNVCIFGRSGVGKSTVVREIRAELGRIGKKCQIVCSSGISCSVYNGLAKTVHSHYGLQTAELPVKSLIERSLQRMNIVEQFENTDVLMWDEISMSSQRLFHIVNLLHQHTSAENTFPFGGIQVILVGDFWQLKPIPSVMDVGNPVYESTLFQEVFPHRFELTEVLRQNEGQESLKDALDMIRFGRCDEETEQYFLFFI